MSNLFEINFVFIPTLMLCSTNLSFQDQSVDRSQFHMFLPHRYPNRSSEGMLVKLRAGLSVVRIPTGAGSFSRHQNVQTGPEAHPASYTMSIGSFPGLKRPGRGVDSSPLYIAEVKKDWSRTSTPLCAFIG